MHIQFASRPTGKKHRSVVLKAGKSAVKIG